MAPEYIKFIYNIKKYTSEVEIKEICINQSKYSKYLKEKNYDGIIGKIDDLEICFLHYEDINEINDKWNRRSKRINWNNIIYKFNAKNKICFTSKKYENINTIQLKQYENEQYVKSDTKESDYKKYIDIYKYINNIEINGDKK